MHRTLSQVAQIAAKLGARLQAGSRVAAISLALGLALPVAAQAAGLAPAQPMSFAIRAGADCGQQGCIVATGVIGARTARDFQTFLRRNAVAAGAVVVMDSGGGDLVQGLRFGRLIRENGLSTIVAQDGQCASACAYAFLGGVQRSLAAGARYGVHQFKAADGQPAHLAAGETQRLLGVLTEYLTAVGASPAIVAAALRTPPQRMHWMSTAELARNAVTTRT